MGFSWFFHETNHPAIGVPPVMETPHELKLAMLPLSNIPDAPLQY